MSLYLNDVFWTIQGEGRHAGRRALFVRMPHCNLRCSWCDTKFDTHDQWDDGKLIEFATREKGRFAVITGGEPLMHRHTPRVVALLKALNYEVAIETNGTFPVPLAMQPHQLDWITCSPKRDADYEVHEDLWRHVDEFKYVVDEGFDFELLARHQIDDGKVYSLSPEFGNLRANVDRILDFLASNPGWRLSLQTHKWIGVP